MKHLQDCAIGKTSDITETIAAAQQIHNQVILQWSWNFSSDIRDKTDHERIQHFLTDFRYNRYNLWKEIGCDLQLSGCPSFLNASGMNRSDIEFSFSQVLGRLHFSASVRRTIFAGMCCSSLVHTGCMRKYCNNCHLIMFPNMKYFPQLTQYWFFGSCQTIFQCKGPFSWFETIKSSSYWFQ